MVLWYLVVDWEVWEEEVEWSTVVLWGLLVGINVMRGLVVLWHFWNQPGEVHLWEVWAMMSWDVMLRSVVWVEFHHFMKFMTELIDIMGEVWPLHSESIVMIDAVI